MGALDAVGLALILAFLCYMLKAVGFSGGRLVGTLGIVGLFFISGEGLGAFMSGISEKLAEGGVSEIFASAAKILGVGYVFGICAEICRDMGESGIASGVLVAGRVEILLISLPYVEKILDLTLELMRI